MIAWDSAVNKNSALGPAADISTEASSGPGIEVDALIINSPADASTNSAPGKRSLACATDSEYSGSMKAPSMKTIKKNRVGTLARYCPAPPSTTPQAAAAVQVAAMIQRRSMPSDKRPSGHWMIAP